MIRIAPITAAHLEELAALYTELDGSATNRERLRETFSLLRTTRITAARRRA